MSDHSVVQVVNQAEQDKIKQKLKGKILPETRYLSVPVTDKFMGYVKMILPVPFNPKKKYPMIVYVYGAPTDQVLATMSGSTCTPLGQILLRL